MPENKHFQAIFYYLVKYSKLLTEIYYAFSLQKL